MPEEAGELVELSGARPVTRSTKFEHRAWRPGPGGTPLLDGCPNRFVGRVLERIDAGDHDALLLEPVLAERGADADEFQLPPREGDRAGAGAVGVAGSSSWNRRSWRTR